MLLPVLFGTICWAWFSLLAAWGPCRVREVDVTDEVASLYRDQRPIDRYHAMTISLTRATAENVSITNRKIHRLKSAYRGIIAASILFVVSLIVIYTGYLSGGLMTAP